MIVVFTFLAVVSALLFSVYKHVTSWKHLKKFPSPPTLPILGSSHLIGLNSVDYLNSLLRWWKEFGFQSFVIWIGYQAFLLITDPKDIETILSSNTLIEKGEAYSLLHDWLGDGLLTAKGKKWFKHRKMITPSFHFAILVEFFDTMNRVSDKFIEKLKAKSESGLAFDIQEMVHYATLDIICETAMGININAMDNPDSEIVSSYQDMCFTTNERSFSVLKRIDFLYWFTSDYRKRRRALSVLKKFTSEVIEKRYKVLNGEEEGKQQNGTGHLNTHEFKRKKAFLDTLLTATIDNRPLTFDEVYEEVSTFMFEGHDTTTSGIVFALYLLAKHPNVQKKVFEEQQDILGDVTQNPTFQQALDMKYLELVIKESQRLYPSVPLIIRETKEDIVLNGKVIPANTSLTIFIIATGYNEQYFPEPNKFNPERFDPANYDKKNPFEYIPFSAGPRNCIGQKFALQELKCVLSKIVRNFEILPATDKAPSYFDGYNWEKNGADGEPCLASALTLKAHEGVYIKLKPRNNN